MLPLQTNFKEATASLHDLQVEKGGFFQEI